MNTTDFLADIPMSAALAAHSGTSFVPERRAESERQGYADTLAADYETLRQHAEKGGTLDLLDAEFARYREGCRRRTCSYLHSRHGLVSWMIAGPSNFPARRMNKRADIVGRRLNELVEGREHALRAAIRNLRPDLRPIMAGDADAVERLHAELGKLERYQAQVKAANAIIRREHRAGDGPSSTWQDRCALILQAEGFTYGRAHNALEPDYAGRYGLPGYILTNNGANIRRIKARIAQIETAQAQPVETRETESGITLEDDPPANRVRLFFPGKPAEDTRTRLKKAGFRWTPSVGCWQAYRNTWSMQTANQIAGEPAKGAA